MGNRYPKATTKRSSRIRTRFFFFMFINVQLLTASAAPPPQFVVLKPSCTGEKQPPPPKANTETAITNISLQFSRITIITHKKKVKEHQNIHNIRRDQKMVQWEVILIRTNESLFAKELCLSDHHFRVWGGWSGNNPFQRVVDVATKHGQILCKTVYMNEQINTIAWCWYMADRQTDRQPPVGSLCSQITHLSLFLDCKFLSMSSMRFSKHVIMAACLSGGCMATIRSRRSLKY